ncbi:hypothetical protein SUDANB121_01877 [Nocardiopsis dassonvillei]
MGRPPPQTVHRTLSSGVPTSAVPPTGPAPTGPAHRRGPSSPETVDRPCRPRPSDDPRAQTAPYLTWLPDPGVRRPPGPGPGSGRPLRSGRHPARLAPRPGHDHPRVVLGGARADGLHGGTPPYTPPLRRPASRPSARARCTRTASRSTPPPRARRCGTAPARCTARSTAAGWGPSRSCGTRGCRGRGPPPLPGRERARDRRSPNGPRGRGRGSPALADPAGTAPHGEGPRPPEGRGRMWTRDGDSQVGAGVRIPRVVAVPANGDEAGYHPGPRTGVSPHAVPCPPACPGVLPVLPCATAPPDP